MSSSASSAPKFFVLQLQPPVASSAEHRHISDLLRKGIISLTEAEQRLIQARSRSLSIASPPPPPPPITSPPSITSGRSNDGRGRAPFTTSQPPVMRAFPHRAIAHMPAASSMYPEISDGTYISHMHGVGAHSWKDQYYTATLVIDEQIPPELRGHLRGPTREVSLPLLVDTGSSDTWALSAIHRRIVIPRDGSLDNERRDLDAAASATLLEPSRVVVTTWVYGDHISNDPRHFNWMRQGQGLINHGYRSQTTAPNPGQLPVERADQRTILGFPEYMNNIAVLLALQKEPERFHFANVYAFGAQSWPSRGPDFWFRFGAALAVPLPMACREFVGILGLSPAHVQDVFPPEDDGRRAPSFINMLIEQGGVVSSELHELGIVLFLRMVQPEFRPVGVAYTPSWTAFNVWPCARVPIWSSPIGVYRFQSYQSWCVIVKAVRLTKRFNIRNKEPETRTFQEAFYAVLDSGTSVSYTPAGLIDMIQAQVLGVNRRPAAHADAGRSGSVFFVPAATDSSTFTLEFVFQARNSQDPDVVVPVPIDPFVYTRSPYQMSAATFPGYSAIGDIRESLLWPVSPETGIDISLLGLNFFQAMHVALHKPDPRIASPQQPYVRLAPDWPWEIGTYSLPPMAT